MYIYTYKLDSSFELFIYWDRRSISMKGGFYSLSGPILINTFCTKNREIDEKYVLEPKEDKRSLLSTPGLRGIPEISEETRWNLFCFSATRG